VSLIWLVHQLIPQATVRKVALSVTLFVLACSTFSHARIFSDEERLWRLNLKHNPNAWAAAGNLGALFMEEGRVPEAITVLESGRQLAPTSFDINANLGMAYAKAGRLVESQAIFENLIERQQATAGVWSSLGHVHALKQEWEAAARCFRAAIGREQNDPRPLVALIEVYLRSNKRDQAKAVLREAMSQFPRDESFEALFRRLNDADPRP
jgi:predicted Zn-dependent protease